MQNGLDSTCTGVFFDTGGQGGGGYQNNESYTYTICPDVPGDVIFLDFITFNLDQTGPNPIDQMTIYDGDNTSAGTLGTYTGTSLNGLTVTASPLNTTGCLTIVFTSNGAGTGNWAANITCDTPCDRPIANATMGFAIPAKICQGETISFDGSSSTAAPGFNISQYLWDFADGTVDSTSGANVNHTFPDEGEYIVELYLVDDNGCASTNRVSLQVLVGTEPDFIGTSPDTTLCLGESVCLDGVVNGNLYTGIPDAGIGAPIQVPDVVGSCFTSTIDYSAFSPGQSLTNINDFWDVCVNFEHSFMGDLVITLYCPSGQSVIMHQQGGGGTFLGVPVDDDSQPNAIGTCYQYCWSPTATNGTWVDNAQATLPAGTYESLNPLSDLVGCDLNGTWTIEFCDLWGSDNGFVCDWNIDFNPAIIPSVTSFTPVYGPLCDSTSWTGQDIISTGNNCNQICVQPSALGAYDYIFSATDDFGCTYDTTITVTVIPGPTAEAGNDTTVCANDIITLNGSVSGVVPQPPCTFTINMFDSFGDGWNGFTIEVFVNGNSIGIYDLPSGSSGTASFTVNDGDIVTFNTVSGTYDGEVTYDVVDCNGATVFSDGPNPAIGNGIWSYTYGNPAVWIYNWTPASGLSDPSIANPTTSISNTTTYYLTVWDAAHPDCFHTDSVTLIIDPSVDPGLPGDTTLCFYEPIFDLFTVLNGTPASGGTWTDSQGNVVSNMFDPLTMLSDTFTYTVQSAFCPPNSTTVSVTVLQPGNPACCSVPIDSIFINPGCPNACGGEIHIVAPLATQYSIDGGVTFQPDSFFVNLCAGNYPDIIVQDALGCQGEGQVTLIDQDPPIANFVFGPQPTTIFNPTINFNNQSIDNFLNTWIFDTLGTSFETDPSFTFPGNEPGSYDVTLIVYNADGCSDTVTYSVIISDELLIYVPNTFTPDGDGINDYFMPVGNDIDPTKYQFYIFNRWGELIFQTDDVNAYWDGTYKSAAPKEDVYVWKIVGRSLSLGRPFEYIGHVTLIK